MQERVIPPPPARPPFWPGVLVGTLSGVLTTLVSGDLLGEYGLFIFVIAPLMIGLVPPLINGWQRRLTFMQAALQGGSALLGAGLLIVAVALEGVLCIVMLLPLALPMVLVGSLAGNFVVRRLQEMRGVRGTAVALVLLTPFVSFIEKEGVDYGYEEDVRSATTSVIIDAPPEDVWPHVISFPDLDEPEELIFRAGIAYPVRVRMVGEGVGAVRYCEFSTGDFIEPITVWDAPRHLAFDVEQTAPPMVELSPWSVEPPHLHGTFVSVRGEFRLEPLPGGCTRLSGTTWYYQKLSPRFYWDLWSNEIVHTIHRRVLEHIRGKVRMMNDEL